MFDEQPDDRQYEDELEDKFRECMLNNVEANRGYNAAKSFGMGEEQRLKAAVIRLTEARDQAMSAISAAIDSLDPEMARHEIVALREDLIRRSGLIKPAGRRE